MSVTLDTEPNTSTDFNYYKFSDYEKLNLNGKYVLVYNKITNHKLYIARIFSSTSVKVTKILTSNIHLSKSMLYSIYENRIYKLLSDEEILAVLL